MVREQARSVVRVLTGDGTTVVGAGFLIGPDLVATCAHVVGDAVAADPYAPEPPQAPVLLDFPLVQEPGSAPVTARVHRWSPIAADGSGDVAVLRLHRPVPHGARMPPLRRVDALWDHGFRVLGFPEGLTDGVWTTGRIRGEQGTRWFQLQGAPGDQAVVGGFSGSPVWDEESGAVVGMTVAADRSADTTTAYLIPIDQVLGLDPELLPCPYRGLEPFGEEHAAFFFGRDPDLVRLVDAVAGQSLVAVAGPSGVGKSSLVRAGLLPRERDTGTRIAELRAAAGTAPATALATSLSTALGAAGSVEDLAARLGSPDPAVRADALRSLVPAPEEPALLLFVDQFEELAATDTVAARELLLLVAELAGDRVRVVLTVRWESLSELLSPAGPDALDPVLDAGSALVTGAVLVGAMDRGRLRDAVVGPAERAPGLSFEPGLVDRILDDAGAEPGQLPLVESLLTELWEHRTGGALTVAAYEAAGGVAGAVAKRAEELLAEFPDPAEQDRLRRLLTLLAQPDRDGRFVRRPVALAELAPELRALVPRLVAGRLLVVQQVPERGEVLELAHQALIQHWPRLQSWLADDRDFLAWRAQLDQQRERWEAAAQDPGALLRGTALAAAGQWLPAREAEVSPADREYLRRSQVRQRRDVRRWRVVTAVLAVLVLAAGTLAVVALDRGNRLDERLRLANAENLAQRARVAAPTDPDLAARLALAAWRADPGNPQARSVLATEYLALQSVQDVYPGFAGAPIDSLVTSDDGDTLLLPGANQGFVVVSGVTSGAPRPWVVPDLRPGTVVRLGMDGRALLTADPDGRVRRWDVPTGTATELLPANPAMDTASLTATPAVDRLAWVEQTAAGHRVVVFDAAAGRLVPNALPPVPEPGLVALHLTADPSTIVLGIGRSGDPQRFEKRSLADGAALWTSPEDAALVAGGVVTCEPSADPTEGAATLVVTGISGGTPGELRRIPLTRPQCTGLQVSLDGGHVIETRPQPLAGSPVLTRLIRIADGATFDADLPPNPDIQGGGSAFSLNARTTVATAPDGTVSVLRASGTSVLRIAATPEPVRLGGQPARQSLTADGRFLVTVDHVGYAAYDRDTRQLLGNIAGAQLPQKGPTTSRVDGDVLSLFVDRPDGWVLDRYAIPGFTPAGTYRLPTRTADQATRGRVDAIVDGGYLYVLGEDQLSVWDTATRTPVGEPMDVSVGGWARPSIVLRPGHPGEVAIRVENGAAIEIWNVLAGQRVARLQPPREQRLLIYSYAFDATGDRLVTLTHVNTMLVWDVATQQLVRPPIPQPTMGGPALGFDADGHVVTSAQTPAEALHISFWDLATGREAGSVDVSASDVGDISPDERSIELPGFGGGLPLTFPLTAQQWRDHLCAFADRPFTGSEVDALPAGFDPGSPCS